MRIFSGTKLKNTVLSKKKISVDDVLSLLQEAKMFQINLLIYGMISIKPPTEKTALRETLFFVNIILN